MYPPGFGGPPGPFDPGYDPFGNPSNDVEHWENLNGQLNQKIVNGPDSGIHRGYDPNNGRTFQTGTERYGKGGG